MAVLLIATAASMVDAHESWLQPVTFLVNKPARQIVHMTSGMGEHYPKTETAIERARITRAGVYFGAADSLPLVAGAESKTRTALTWTPTRTGVAMAWVDLGAKVLDLPDSLIDVYLDEIGASAELRKQWTDTPSPKKWRESYVKHAKTYVRVGPSRAATPWRASAGLDLEMIPDRDPTLLFAGDTLRVRVVYKGQPLPDFTVASFREGGSKPDFHKTDASGSTSLVYRKSGAVLLAAVHLRRVHEPNLEWRSDFSSMTFPIRARK